MSFVRWSWDNNRGPFVLNLIGLACSLAAMVLVFWR